jgi:hypothetical protein
MSPAELIEAAGRALFGNLWKKDLARKLGVAERNVYRWVGGQFTPRPGVFVDLLAMMKERREELAELIDTTEAYLAETEK